MTAPSRPGFPKIHGIFISVQIRGICAARNTYKVSRLTLDLTSHGNVSVPWVSRAPEARWRCAARVAIGVTRWRQDAKCVLPLSRARNNPLQVQFFGRVLRNSAQSESLHGDACPIRNIFPVPRSLQWLRRRCRGHVFPRGLEVNSADVLSPLSRPHE